MTSLETAVLDLLKTVVVTAGLVFQWWLRERFEGAQASNRARLADLEKRVGAVEVKQAEGRASRVTP